MADSSEASWLTAKRYEFSAVVLDTEDDKAIREAGKKAHRAKYKFRQNNCHQHGFPGKHDSRSRLDIRDL